MVKTVYGVEQKRYKINRSCHHLKECLTFFFLSFFYNRPNGVLLLLYMTINSKMKDPDFFYDGILYLCNDS